MQTAAGHTGSLLKIISPLDEGNIEDVDAAYSQFLKEVSLFEFRCVCDVCVRVCACVLVRASVCACASVCVRASVRAYERRRTRGGGCCCCCILGALITSYSHVAPGSGGWVFPPVNVSCSRLFFWSTA